MQKNLHIFADQVPADTEQNHDSDIPQRWLGKNGAEARVQSTLARYPGDLVRQALSTQKADVEPSSAGIFRFCI